MALPTLSVRWMKTMVDEDDGAFGHSPPSPLLSFACGRPLSKSTTSAQNFSLVCPLSSSCLPLDQELEPMPAMDPEPTFNMEPEHTAMPTLKRASEELLLNFNAELVPSIVSTLKLLHPLSAPFGWIDVRVLSEILPLPVFLSSLQAP